MSADAISKAFQISSFVASGLARRRFSLIVESNKNGSYIVRVTERGKSPKQRCFQTQSEALKTFHKIVTYFSP